MAVCKFLRHSIGSKGANSSVVLVHSGHFNTLKRDCYSRLFVCKHQSDRSHMVVPVKQLGLLRNLPI